MVDFFGIIVKKKKKLKKKKLLDFVHIKRVREREREIERIRVLKLILVEEKQSPDKCENSFLHINLHLFFFITIFSIIYNLCYYH